MLCNEMPVGVILRSYCLIVGINVVLKRTILVEVSMALHNQSGSHQYSQLKVVCQSNGMRGLAR